MSRDVIRDLVAAGLILAVAAVFWTRQDFDTPSDVIFPRFVLVVLLVLALAIGVTALVRMRGGGSASGAGAPDADAAAPPPSEAVPMRGRNDNRSAAEGVPADAAAEGAEPSRAAGAAEGSDADPAEVEDEEELAESAGDRPRWAMPAAAALLLAWGTAFGLFGITLSGAVAFVLAAVLIRRGTGGARRLLLDAAVALVVVLFCWAVFTRLLYVPLPVSVILGV
ncbi:tripartite tricarboxylate transporter TctB family protein [Streptomonospora wellingtoniae]|uniref:Tripartite tricarboxylate transporter TctB family protein n=1 Tax=Streptomonospora wellingtoniae TaxID=3075544 RepID=A0ABU2KYF7_9ACTN|nr:tripartite tricarboxylate transporter TctB family protein [Streptomonospora sp. DSM 45055]MDT0304043.1 tripartite tricarboxylate transporter TctB family protein [Streptomonospora sp. DSM 45055]